MTKILGEILYLPLFNLLVLFVWLIPGHSLGWAVIILTILTRLILLPITIHTTKAQVRMKQLQPKIEELRQKYKDDKNLQMQAQMAMYKEEGVSPFGSCLPMIVQLVILIVLYDVFRNGLDTSHFNNLYNFTPRPSAVDTNFFGLNLAVANLWILPIVVALSQLWLGFVTLIPGSDPNDPTTKISKQMIYFAPIMTFIFAREFPAALPLYWLVTNLFTIVQQEYVVKRYSILPQSVSKDVVKMIESKEEEEEKKKDAEQKHNTEQQITKKASVKLNKKTKVTVTVRDKGK